MEIKHIHETAPDLGKPYEPELDLGKRLPGSGRDRKPKGMRFSDTIRKRLSSKSMKT